MNTALTSLFLASEFKPGEGLIIGGWEYVWAAWGITWAGIVLYALSLWMRRRAAELAKEPS